MNLKPKLEGSQKPKRVWLRRLGFTALTLFLLIALFHRPLVFRGTKYLVVRLAKEQKLNIDYKIGGSIFTSLVITNLRATPTEPGPVERLEVGALDLRYSLPELVRKGLPGLLKDVALRDVFVVIDPAKSVPREKVAKEQKGAKFPALFPTRLNLQNINFISRSATGDTELAGLHFSLEPETPGVFRIETLNVPGVRRWQQIAATTTFREQNLVLSDLAIGSEIALKRVQLDASKLNADQVSFALEGAVLGATVSLSAALTDLNETNRLNLRADVAGLEIAAVAKYLGKPLPVNGSLPAFNLQFHGVPDQPAGWAGNVKARMAQLTFEQQALGNVEFKVDLGSGRAIVTIEDNFDDRTRLTLQAEAALPEKLGDFPQTTASGRLDLVAADLGTLTESFSQKVAGDVTARLDFKITNGQLDADLALDSARISGADAEVAKLNLAVHLEKNVAKKSQPVFADLVTRVRGSIASVRLGDYTGDGLTLALTSRGAAVTLEKLALTKAGNALALEGRYTLPDDLKSWVRMPVAGSIDLSAPDLSAFTIPGSEAQLGGELTIRGNGNYADELSNGAFTVAGRAIRFRGMTVRDIGGEVNIVNGSAHLPNFGVYLDEKNFVNIGAEVGQEPPQKYSGWVEGKLSDLSVFAPLLASADKPAPKLGGSLEVSWRGSGEIQAASHLGSGMIDLTGGRFGDQENLAAHLATTYSPEQIDIPELRLTAAQGEAAAAVRWAEKQLTVRDLAVRRGGRVLLDGSLELPLDLAQRSDPDLLIPDDVPVKIALASRELDLAWLFQQIAALKPPTSPAAPPVKTAQLKKPPRPAGPPLNGTLNTNISAEGTIKDFVANISVRGTRLQSTSAEKLAPADVSLDLDLRNDRLKVSGSVKQRDIRPLTLTGDLPLDVAAVKKARALDPQTPLALRVSLPRSPLGFVSALVPALRFIDGTAAIDLRAEGTISKPILSGSAQADIPNLRMKNPSLPPLNGVVARIDFTRDEIAIRQLRSGIAGGSFSAGGSVSLAKPTEPVLDLRLQTREALVMQNDNISARVTSDLRIAGPMNAGTVTGRVGITRSRFFKDIDILPIGLPGRPAPQPPAEAAPVSFPNPPLRDWKFDVAIRTDDPFLIQGNLANGRAVADLKLAGTGLKPWLDGSIRVEQLMTSLPFSRLEITQGNIYFTAAKPFVAQLDIRGESVIRDYTVNVFISGDASKPQALFTSDPPLPQAEIVALIATGATTQELTNDPNALAGRAGLLVAQKLFRKVFRKNEPAQPSETPFRNVQLDVGAPDPHSGQQSVQLRVPMSERVVLTGGVDVGGSFRGQIKYLVKFK